MSGEFWNLSQQKKCHLILTVESSCGIEPQSLVNENLTIRLWRFTQIEAGLVIAVVVVVVVIVTVVTVVVVAVCSSL